MFRYISTIFRESYISALLKSQNHSDYKFNKIEIFTFVIITVDDKIQCIKRCELSVVIITVHGSCQLGAVYTS